jgi:hypothetical protein
LLGLAGSWGSRTDSRFVSAVLMAGSPYNRRALTLADLPPTEKVVLEDLLDRAHAHEAIPGTRERAKELHVSRPTLLLAEERLVEKGYLLRQGGGGRRNVYLPTFPAIPRNTEGRAEFEAKFRSLAADESGQETCPVSESGQDTCPDSGQETGPLSVERSRNLSASPESGQETCPVSAPEEAPKTGDSFISTDDPGTRLPPSNSPQRRKPVEEWEPLWQRFLVAYPKRSGDRCLKDGRQRFGLLLKAGMDPETIIAGCERYAAWCDATGKTGTELVRQITTWLNKQSWEAEWSLPTPEELAMPTPANGRHPPRRHEAPTEDWDAKKARRLQELAEWEASRGAT